MMEKWVPDVPTPQMLEDVGTMEGFNDDEVGMSEVDRCHIDWYKAMLAAAPSPFKAVDTLPSDSEESTPFMVMIKNDLGYVTVQVSWWEGHLYPDHLEANVDFDDHIPPEKILGWMPAPEMGNLSTTTN